MVSDLKPITFISCATLDKSFNLSVLQFPYSREFYVRIPGTEKICDIFLSLPSLPKLHFFPNNLYVLAVSSLCFNSAQVILILSR